MVQSIEEWTKLILWKTAFKKFEADHITSNFLKAVFNKFYLVHFFSQYKLALYKYL